MITYIPEENIFIIRECQDFILSPLEKSLYVNMNIPLLNDVYLYRIHDDVIFVEDTIYKINNVMNSVDNFYEKIIMSIFYNSFDPITTLSQVLKMTNDEMGGVIDYVLDRYIREIIDIIRTNIKRVLPNYSCYVGGEDYRILVGNEMLIGCGDYYYLRSLRVLLSNSGLDVLIEIKHKGENNDESESE